MVSFGHCRAIRSSRVSPATIKADILRLFRVRPIHDAGMKKKNHVIFVGTVVDGPVCSIVIVFPCGSDLTQTPKSRGMEAVDLLENIRIIQLDIPKTYKAVGMFLNEFTGLREALRGWSAKMPSHQRHSIYRVVFQEPRLAIVMHMHVDKFWRMRLRRDC